MKYRFEISYSDLKLTVDAVEKIVHTRIKQSEGELSRRFRKSGCFPWPLRSCSAEPGPSRSDAALPMAQRLRLLGGDFRLAGSRWRVLPLSRQGEAMAFQFF
jgi:hypothetical protein